MYIRNMRPGRGGEPSVATSLPYSRHNSAWAASRTRHERVLDLLLTHAQLLFNLTCHTMMFIHTQSPTQLHEHTATDATIRC